MDLVINSAPCPRLSWTCSEAQRPEQQLQMMSCKSAIRNYTTKAADKKQGQSAASQDVMRNNLQLQPCRAPWLIIPVKSHISTGKNIYLKPSWRGRRGHQAAVELHTKQKQRGSSKNKNKPNEDHFPGKKKRQILTDSAAGSWGFTAQRSCEQLEVLPDKLKLPLLTQKWIRFWDVVVKILHTWAWWLSSHWAHTIAGSRLIRTEKKKNKK